MSLAEIVADVSTKFEREGVFDRDAAINAALPRVLAESYTVEQIVRQHISKAIKQRLTRAQDVAMKSFGSTQPSLFELHPAHILQGAEGVIKSTASLSRIEFMGLIKVRERQVKDDLTYLARLKFAADECSPIWDKNPSWTWGQVEDAYRRRMQKAA